MAHHIPPIKRAARMWHEEAARPTVTHIVTAKAAGYKAEIIKCLSLAEAEGYKAALEADAAEEGRQVKVTITPC